MTFKVKSMLAGGVLLLVLVQICLAAGQQDESFEKIWGAFGQKAQSELLALPAKGRAAFQKALIACSIYADAYANLKYTSECETTSNYFMSEFSDNSSALSVLFQAAMSLTSAHNAQAELELQQAQRPRPDDNLRKVYIEVLLKAYRDTTPVR
jgi:hypothetical protein